MTHQNILAALRENFLFESLSDEEVRLLARECHLVTRCAGEMLFAEGDPATHFFVLLSGQVQAYKISAEGKEMILHLFGPSEMFAEYPVFEGVAAYPVSTLCLKPSKLLAIQGEGFKRLAANNPGLLLRLLSRMAERLRYFSNLIADLSLRNVDARLAKYLLSASPARQAETEIEIQKKTLAAILGTVPETLSRSFKKLSNEGLIAVRGNRITLCNRQGLEALAETA